MLRVYVGGEMQLLDVAIATKPPSGVIWIDALHPTEEECQWVLRHFHWAIPTLEKMQEIEATSRIYEEEGVLHMTANLIVCSERPHAQSVPVAFILSETLFLTVRFAQLIPFETLTRLIAKQRPQSAALLCCALFEVIIDHIADLLEEVGYAMDEVSHEVFQKRHSEHDLSHVLTSIGQKGDLVTNIRLSLENVQRLIKFAMGRELLFLSKDKGMHRLATVQNDIVSIVDYTMFLSNKINFLLDATLGVINLEQSRIIKIFSMAAVIFLPPMLIASIYGMNFHIMPELTLWYGYPIAIVLMILSSILSYAYFKCRGWL